MCFLCLCILEFYSVYCKNNIDRFSIHNYDTIHDIMTTEGKMRYCVMHVDCRMTVIVHHERPRDRSNYVVHNTLRKTAQF